MALKNALFAKIAYEMMPEDAKAELDIAAWGYYEGSGNPNNISNSDNINWESMTEFERYTMCSYVLMDNGIMPPIKGEQWLNPPRNPFTIRFKQKELDKAVGYFGDKHNLNVSIAV